MIAPTPDKRTRVTLLRNGRRVSGTIMATEHVFEGHAERAFVVLDPGTTSGWFPLADLEEEVQPR